MSRGQIRNATGDFFFIWEGDVLVINILGKPNGTQLKVSVTAGPQSQVRQILSFL